VKAEQKIREEIVERKADIKPSSDQMSQKAYPWNKERQRVVKTLTRLPAQPEGAKKCRKQADQ
jgi:hypothetical protein